MALTSRIVDHDPGLRAGFATEAGNLKDAFGDSLVAVHHVGSTPIPGLAAKPEIDMLVVLTPEGASRPENHSRIMKALGYEPDGQAVPGHWYYQKDLDGRRTHKAHICSVGHDEVWKMLLFRDYLLDHPDRARAYGNLKIHLQNRNRSGMREYLDGKRDFILETIEMALSEGRVKPKY